MPADRTDGRPEPHDWVAHLPFADRLAVADATRDRIPPGALSQLLRTADAARVGRIECFGRWTASFGDPIDWHRHPLSGIDWPARAISWRAMAATNVGDVKLSWEVARFPHAYHMARAAAFFPDRAADLTDALATHIHRFNDANPIGIGIHWASGQEIAFRLLAWLFAADTLIAATGAARTIAEIRRSLIAGAAYIEANLDYARLAVYNNHLLSEALALFVAGALLPEITVARQWRELGREILDAEAQEQFYPDGAYIQQSHTYHRVALHDLLWASAFARSMGDAPSVQWLAAIERSIDFLVAHQNETNGQLPNYGSNDGSMPGIFSTCDFTDFRPVLQTAHVLARGERLYPPGPWDEMLAWVMGPVALEAPLRPPHRKSISFGHTGYHVMRGDGGCFAAFRCGTLLDRFSQIDMLHLDVWWRDVNVLVDAGSYLYNDRPEWHEHFMRTGCHNTLTIDARDQMLHFRQFKVLYRTHARLLRFAEEPSWTLCEGEHSGYRRHPGGCTHTRSVLFVRHGLWIVVDTVHGDGVHDLRLHWLGGPFPYVYEGATARLTMTTAAGDFNVQVVDSQGAPLAGNVAAGEVDPPRGWLSRYYGERIPAPSLAVEATRALPLTFVSVLAGSSHPEIEVVADRWTIAHEGISTTFSIVDGRVRDICTS